MPRPPAARSTASLISDSMPLKRERPCDSLIALTSSSRPGPTQSMTKKLHILFCSSPLQFVHAHLVRHSGVLGEGEVQLFCEPPISPMVLVPGMWDGVTELASSKRQFVNAITNIRRNLEIFETSVNLANYDHIHLVISDVFW